MIVDSPFSIFVFPIMPEFPDVTVYIEALTERVLNQPIQKIRIGSPFVLRSFEPPLSAAEGKKVLALRRLGKRIVFELEDDLFLIVHLMIAGRFHWKPKGAKIARKYGQAAFDFPHGTLLLTEAGTKKRASIHLVRGEAALQEHDPGGLEVLDASLAQFREALTRENHTFQTFADRSAFIQRYRQCLFRRDSPSRQTIADSLDAANDGRGDRTSLSTRPRVVD